jgi:hypothetical protein
VRESPGQPQRGLGRHGEIAIRDRRVVDGRHGRRRHVLQVAQPSARAHEGTRRPEAGHEVRETARGLLENLNGCRVIVRPPIKRIAVLVWIEVPIWRRGRPTTRFEDGGIGAAEGIGQDDRTSARNVRKRSRDALAGMHSSTRCPRAAPIIA